MKNGEKKKEKAWRRIWAFIGLMASGMMKVFLFLVVIAAVSLCLLSLYECLLASPYARLEEVDIRGVDPKLREEIIREYGLDANQSLLGLHLEELRQKMEMHPWIRSVRLERRLPRTLLVEIEKEVPTALARLDDLYYVNRWGEIFKQATATDDMDLPVITGISMEDPHLGADLKKAVEAVGVLSCEEEPWSASDLSEIHMRKDGAISLYFSHLRAEITLKGNELAARMDGLKRLAKHLNESGKIHMVTRINLNYVDGAVVSFSKG